MNGTILKLLLCLVIFSCTHKQEQPLKQKETDSLDRKMMFPDSTLPPYFWEALPDDETNRITLHKVPLRQTDTVSIHAIIARLNKKYDPVTMTFIKRSGDTIYVRISPSHALTEQLGSTGADLYMTEATYNLCGLSNIRFANFNFKAGDHASPGTYSRNNFLDVRIK